MRDFKQKAETNLSKNELARKSRVYLLIRELIAKKTRYRGYFSSISPFLLMIFAIREGEIKIVGDGDYATGKKVETEYRINLGHGRE